MLDPLAPLGRRGLPRPLRQLGALWEGVRQGLERVAQRAGSEGQGGTGPAAVMATGGPLPAMAGQQARNHGKDPLAGLTSLHTLPLNQTGVTDLTPLAGLPNLTVHINGAELRPAQGQVPAGGLGGQRPLRRRPK